VAFHPADDFSRQLLAIIHANSSKYCRLLLSCQNVPEAIFRRQIQQQLHRGLLNYQFSTVYSAYMPHFFISSERVIKYKSQGL
jgi:hypothetical protein